MFATSSILKLSRNYINIHISVNVHDSHDREKWQLIYKKDALFTLHHRFERCMQIQVKWSHFSHITFFIQEFNFIIACNCCKVHDWPIDRSIDVLWPRLMLGLAFSTLFTCAQSKNVFSVAIPRRYFIWIILSDWK